MAHEQIAPRGEFLAETLEQFGLGGPFKVDDYIAAEDDVHPFAHLEIFHKVHTPKLDLGPEFRDYAHQLLAPVLTLEKVLTLHVRRNGLGNPQFVYRLLGCLQGAYRYVCGQDIIIKPKSLNGVNNADLGPIIISISPFFACIN